MLVALKPGPRIKEPFIRFTDFLKSRASPQYHVLISSPFTATTPNSNCPHIDTWIVLEHVRTNGEYRRLLRILKSRGMNHSSSIAELRFTDRGILLKGGSW